MGIPIWVTREHYNAHSADVFHDQIASNTHSVQTKPHNHDDSEEILQHTATQKIALPPNEQLHSETPALNLNWSELAEQVKSCQQCTLAKTRINPVFGVGDKNTSLMIIGEAPGAEEDRLGSPFIGRAGELLTNMLHAIGITREQTYITNLLKCRPPNNRDPKVEEISQCQKYLIRQIELVNPCVILVLGRISAQHLLGKRASLAQLRRQAHILPNNNTPIIVTYHPAYLLRQPKDKRKTWQDLQQLQQYIST